MDQSYSPAMQQTVHEYLDSLIRDLPVEKELAALQSLSARFNRRMQRLVRRDRAQAQRVRPGHLTHMGYRKRLVILVIIITIMASAFSISASRDAIVGFMVRTYEKFSTIIFTRTPTATGQSSNPVDPGKITDRLPTYLPKGYVLTEQTNGKSLVQMVFTNEAGQELLYIKNIKAGLRIDIDSEGIQIESLMINQNRGIYYSNKGINSLIWEDDIYAYSIIGKVSKNEMINMANSTNLNYGR